MPNGAHCGDTLRAAGRGVRSTRSARPDHDRDTGTSGINAGSSGTDGNRADANRANSRHDPSRADSADNGSITATAESGTGPARSGPELFQRKVVGTLRVPLLFRE